MAFAKEKLSRYLSESIHHCVITLQIISIGYSSYIRNINKTNKVQGSLSDQQTLT